MAEFVITAAGAAVLCTLLELLVPNSRLKQTVRFAIGLLFMALLLSAVDRLTQQAASFPLSWKSADRPQQEAAAGSQERLIEELYEREWERILLEEEQSEE